MPRVRRAAVVASHRPGGAGRHRRGTSPTPGQATRRGSAGRTRQQARGGAGDAGSSRARSALGRERELAMLAKSRGPGVASPPGGRGAARPEGARQCRRGTPRKPACALLAVSRLTDAAELEGVAVRGEHADAAVAAIDAIREPSLDLLTGIAQKARTKAGAEARPRCWPGRSRRHRRSAEPLRVDYKEADQERARELVAQMSGAWRAGRPGGGARRIRRRARRMGRAAGRRGQSRPDSSRRSRQASGRGARPRSPPTTAPAWRPTARARRGSASRPSARRCARASRRCTGDDIPDRLAAARAEWEGMPAMPEDWAAELNHRFDGGLPRGGEAARAPADQARELAERLPALRAGDGGRGRGRELHRGAQASGSRSASSGRRLRASWRSIPS